MTCAPDVALCATTTESEPIVATEAEKKHKQAGAEELRWNICREHKLILEEVYRYDKYPSKGMHKRLADEFGVQQRQVQFWFQNRRQRDRRIMRDCGRAAHLTMPQLP